MARNDQPCARRAAAAAPSVTSIPQALPCRRAAARTVSRASTKAGAVMSPGTPRSWLRSRGPMNSTSTPSMAAISSAAATAAADSICTTHERSRRRPGPARRGRARTGRPGCRWRPRGRPAAGSAGGSARRCTSAALSSRGSMMPAAPLSSTRPIRIRSRGLDADHGGDAVAPAAGTTSRTCSSPPAPCSRSSSTQSNPAAAHTSALTAGGHADERCPGWLPAADGPGQGAAVERVGGAGSSEPPLGLAVVPRTPRAAAARWRPRRPRPGRRPTTRRPPGRSACGMAATTMTTVPWWPRVSSSASRSSAAVSARDGLGAEPGGDLHQVDGQVVAVQAGRLVRPRRRRRAADGRCGSGTRCRTRGRCGTSAAGG